MLRQLLKQELQNLKLSMGVIILKTKLMYLLQYSYRHWRNTAIHSYADNKQHYRAVYAGKSETTTL
ncbi:hypothetical protein EYF80_001228 [Liparis tanakae]|uniref:Uncharacterized protein n=1 Tax=Liparis tanakae TaxID=230148 RepID=A0A4Z2JDW5_9TELE|nr:hypothetical protein EYF80_001228 [Liparis tanakae]